jgi:large subunit ribosomal protein L21
MYAVIKTGGKQYRVTKDDVIAVEKLSGDAGSVIVFDQVLALGDKIGAPRVSGAEVVAEVVRQMRDDKKIIFKKRRRKHYRRRTAHRQYLTLVKITDMGTGIGAAALAAHAAKPKAEPAAEVEAKPAKKAAAKKAPAKKAAAPKAAAKKTTTKKAKKAE